MAGGPSVVRTVFDVGANDGADSLPSARLHPDIEFIAIEPTPSLAAQLESQSRDLPNYRVVGCAIGTLERQATLTIRGSSVLNSLEDYDRRSLERLGIPLETYAAQDQVAVPVRTLRSVCEELSVSSIDVLHVDTQGSDMEVLASAGEMLGTVRAGVVEVGRRLNLYSNTVGRREFVDFLQSNGLNVVRIEANDPWNAEQNVFFTHRKSRFPQAWRSRAEMVRADLEFCSRWIRAHGAIRTRIRRLIAQTRGAERSG